MMKVADEKSLILDNLFSDMTNSYKIYWFKGIYEEIIRENRIITFKNIVIRMIASVWYPILTYHLNFGTQDQMSIYVKEINSKYIKNANIDPNELIKKLLYNDNLELKQLIDNIADYLCRYVPYRLLRTFYKNELRGLADGKVNGGIESLAKRDNNALYIISSEQKMIVINESWFYFIYDNQNIINGWLKYKIVEFLQLKNPNVPAILNKLEFPKKRDLSIAKKYWNFVLDNTEIKDIYSEQTLDKDNISIDHFIPWSFIGNDKLWNLIPTFSNINSSKNDGLPLWDKYFNKFATVQYQGIKIYKRLNCINKKIIEDYLEVNSNIYSKELKEVDFKERLSKILLPQYTMALNQGFGIWNYKNILNSKDIENIKIT